MEGIYAVFAAGGGVGFLSPVSTMGQAATVGEQNMASFAKVEEPWKSRDLSHKNAAAQ